MLIFSYIKKIIYGIVVAFFASTILSVILFRFVPVPITPLMLIRLTEQLKEGKDIKLKHSWVSIEKIKPAMQKAVIASEDAHFLSHHGFDFEAIQKAAKQNKKHPEKRILGGSTITQQTAKNVFLWPKRSWVRKGLEAYFTVLIELTWPKKRIIEVYLNSIEMGDGIYGVEAVAKEHFNSSANKLTEADCALIAATLPNPRRFSSLHPSPYIKKRQNRILNEMKHVTEIPK